MTAQTTFSTRDRALAGAILSLVDLDTWEERVVHTAGTYRDWRDPATGKKISESISFEQALRFALEDVRTWDGEWRVRCISTPETILGDLRGRKEGPLFSPVLYEAQILGRIGLTEMLERPLHDESRRAAQRRDARRRARERARSRRGGDAA